MKFTQFEIPKDNQNKSKLKSLSDCQSCNDALDPDLRQRTDIYEQRNLRNWLNQYFKSNETHRRTMKENASQDANLSAVVKSIPITFGYKSDESTDYNYWNKKYIEWSNTRLISIDDIAYLFKSDSKDQLKAWLECKKASCGFSAAHYADNSIFLDFKKIRDGKYTISLTNLSKANIKITEIQVDDVLEKESGNSFRKNKIVSNKGGEVTAIFNSKSKIDVDFIINVSYKIVGTDDEENTEIVYRVKPKLPDVPIGTIISTTFTYDQFLQANQLKDLSTSEQAWLPCDGRSVPNGNFITKTPDLRGLFSRGANVMDVNEGLHTNTVSNNQRNPDNTKIGAFQQHAYEEHNHKLENKIYRWDRSFSGHSTGPHVLTNGSDMGSRNSKWAFETNFSGTNSETRPKNISVLYLIKVR